MSNFNRSWHGDDRNMSIRLPDSEKTKYAGELRAVLARMCIEDTSTQIVMKTSSKSLIQALCSRLRSWEDRGWIGVTNSDLLRAVAARLRLQGSRIVFHMSENSVDMVGAKRASELALAGAQKDIIDEIDYVFPKRFTVSGAKLNAVSQATLSAGIRLRKKRVTRQTTEANLDITRWAAKVLGGVLPTDEKIWRSMRKKSISRNIREFLWKTMHGAFKIGKYWENIPGYEERSTCPKCGVAETMEHILTECAIPGQLIVWSLAEELWRKKNATWPGISLGKVLACGLSCFSNDKGKIVAERSRLYEIIVSESAHLIWKFRCERRIQRGDDSPGDWHSPREIRNRWVQALNNRLAQDCMATDVARFGNKALRRDLVLRTWNGVLLQNDALPNDWVGNTEVLVGIEPVRKRPRGRLR
ncbi:ribonuclease H-like protein [Desarmillaria tabescens]|uniref:Ribonuclease H-like protein n=1 Tax=Armillaria tabescens TaxID=1929756 RepID=A0AA39NDM9_ARMTA|nr:ribonuclease H-like protein [Desarmillaria tabescens]KAK0463726.1 ribonuclease H-like protein [Desarmillaria tabescens]